MSADRIPLAEAKRRHSPQAPNPEYIAPKLYGVVDPITLANLPVPERRWLVDDWIPLNAVTMLSGDGGTGKSLLAQQLLTACAADRAWLGRRAMPCKAIGIFCEDDAHELQRRQVAINEPLGIGFGDLEQVQWCSRVGDDNALMNWEQYEAAGTPTEFFQQIHDWAQDFGAQLIVLDALHDLFPGNENSRPHARQFIQLLASLARDCDGAVVLTAHPSLSGRASGTGESGSTAWNNAVRSRLYLSTPDDGIERSERLLSRKKANYAAAGDTIPLRWEAGVFVPEDAPTGIFSTIHKRTAEKVFLELLDAVTEQGRSLSASKNAGNYAPSIFARHPDRQSFKRGDFERAMESLFSGGAIRLVDYGRTGDLRKRIERVRQDKADG